MKPRNRIFIIMAVLLVVALVWYLFSTNHTSDLQLIGTVDANEVIVSSRIQGRIASLAVDEGQKVTTGQLVATIEADDLAAARNAAAATVAGPRPHWRRRRHNTNIRKPTRNAPWLWLRPVSRASRSGTRWSPA